MGGHCDNRLIRVVRARLTVAALVVVSGTAAAAPRIAVDPQRMDFGRIRGGETVQKSVSIRNEGDAPLRIHSVQSSCPCVVVESPPPDRSTVPPGAAYELKVRYESRDRVGPQAAVIAISTDDPDQPALIIEVVADVEVLVMARPPNGITWGLARRGSALDKVLALVPGNREHDIELVSVAARDPGMTVAAEEAERQGERMIELRFQLDRDLPLGEYATVVEARVRVNQEEAVVTVPVRGQVIGDVIVSPPAIFSPKTSYAQGQRISEITIRSSTEGPPPALLGAMAVGPVRAAVLANAPADRHVIAVSAAENAPGGPQSGMVYVMTASSDEPVVGVPVYFRAAPPVDVIPENVVLDMEAKTEQRVELRSRGAVFVEIKDIGFESEIVSADVETSRESGPDSPAAIRIRPASGWTPGKSSTIVVIETNVPGGARLYLPVVIREGRRERGSDPGRLEPAGSDGAE